MTKFNHRAKYLLPGSFFAEDDSRELSDRSIDAALAVAPENAFAFKLYDVAVVDFEFPADLFRILPIPQNESATHYIGGEVFTSDELRALAHVEGDPGKYDVLIANVTHYTPEGHIEGRAIRCRTGNWQQFHDDDVLVEALHA